MSERDSAETDLDSTFKALAVFGTLRTNLALFSSLARQSMLEPSSFSGEDLGFVGVEPGENQLKAHNSAITKILVALLTQALRNYFELRSIKPRLEDPDLEQFLDQLDDRETFVRGMTKVRNGVFHVKSRRAWRDRDIVALHDVFQRSASLSALLYDFTQKCFSGDLKIFPLEQYEEIESLDPALFAKMGAGEATFEELIAALRACRRSERRV